MRAWLTILLIVFAACAAHAEPKPSFSCTDARSKVEKLVCENVDLARLDVALAAAYQTALRAGAISEEVQLDWIRRNEVCFDERNAGNADWCLRERYKERIALLLGSSQASTPHEARPPFAETREVCGYVIGRGPSISDELIKDGMLDANNDGRDDAVSIRFGRGSMGGQYPVFWPAGMSTKAEPVQIRQKGYEGKNIAGYGAGWLKYGKYVYTLYFETERYRSATYLGYIDPDNIEHIVCDFENSEEENLRAESSTDAELCAQVAGHQVEYVQVTPATPEERAQDFGRSWTKIGGWIDVDFRNSGRQETLAFLEYSGTAGRGCSFSYYEAAEQHLPTSGDAHALLMKLQNVDPNQFFSPGPSCAGNEPQWFVHNGRTYFDSRAAGPYTDAPFHQVSQVRDSEIKRICQGKFEVKWRVKSLWPYL